ncbi:hypothetical protein Ddc_10235 [Ditylenchus destructor]|nr:hypothetical protein Ddc_10235 [Ditylenchus destructor]
MRNRRGAIGKWNRWRALTATIKQPIAADLTPAHYPSAHHRDRQSSPIFKVEPELRPAKELIRVYREKERETIEERWSEKS